MSLLHLIIVFIFLFLIVWRVKATLMPFLWACGGPPMGFKAGVALLLACHSAEHWSVHFTSVTFFIDTFGLLINISLRVDPRCSLSWLDTLVLHIQEIVCICSRAAQL